MIMSHDSEVYSLAYSVMEKIIPKLKFGFLGSISNILLHRLRTTPLQLSLNKSHFLKYIFLYASI